MVVDVGRGLVGAAIVMVAWAVGACAGVAPSGPEGAAAQRPVSPSASASPSPSPSAVASPPVAEKKTVTETVEIPFERVTREDSSLASGKRVVSVKGAVGTKTLTYEVTLVDGVQTDRRLVSEVVTKAAVAEVTRVGTKPASNCDPNYTGACVPIASDVDCAGGGGNGPAYVRGPVRVVGTDIYDLDRDGDGIGCE